MATYTIIIKGVKIENMERAADVTNAFQNIANRLTEQEIIELSNLLTEKPGIVQKAKQFKHLL